MSTYIPPHSELVIRAERWLRSSQGCSVVLAELVTQAGEIPDAIGWKNATSTLVECKTSVADFKRDAAKIHHRAGTGIGTYRYYLVPPGMLRREDVPPYWGLLECYSGSIKVIKKATTRSKEEATLTYRLQKEIAMLTSALRRQAPKPPPKKAAPKPRVIKRAVQ